MKKFIVFFIVLFSYAKVVTSSLVVAGYGNTPNSAIKDALITAVSQIYGIDISAKINSFKSSITSSFNDSSNVVINKSFLKNVKTYTSGKVKKFDILSITTHNNVYIAKLKVYFNEYKPTGLSASSRRTIAVFPFLGADKKFSIALTQNLVNLLSKVRKFNVIDRSDSAILDIEKLFLLDINTRSEEILKLHKRIGSDYILIGNVRDVKYKVKKIQKPLSDKIEYKKYAKVIIDYKILDTVSGIVKWGNRFIFEIQIDNNDIYSLSEKVCKKIINDMIYNIYPPVIIAADDRYVTINVGGDFFKKGEIYEIYSKGEKLYDPYTKEFLGYNERKVGLTKIIKVNAKTSIGIYKGKARIGYIIRRKK